MGKTKPRLRRARIRGRGKPRRAPRLTARDARSAAEHLARIPGPALGRILGENTQGAFCGRTGGDPAFDDDDE